MNNWRTGRARLGESS